MPEVPDDHEGAGAAWRALAARTVADALGPPAGPVHLQPPVPRAAGAHRVAAGRRARSLRRSSVDRAGTGRARPERRDARRARRADRRRPPRGLVVAGWGAGVQRSTLLRFADVAGWPVLADPISNLRVPGHRRRPTTRCSAVAGFAGAHRPDVVLRVGGPAHQQGRDAVARRRRSTRSWSIPTVRGSIRSTR